MVGPIKIALVCPPLRIWYIAKLWDMPVSLLVKSTVTLAPAGTVIVD